MPNPAPHPDDHPEDAQARMSFGEHLEELRKRIVHALLGSLIGIGLCLFFYKEIIDIIARPYKLIAELHHLPGVFNTLKPQEAFLTSITLAFQAGLLISSPWIIYQIWQFIASGLYPKERKVVYRYTAPSAFLFLIGVSFFYFIVLPMTLNFFMTFTTNTAGPAPTPNWIERMMGFSPHPAPPPTTQPITLPSTQPTTQTGPNIVQSGQNTPQIPQNIPPQTQNSSTNPATTSNNLQKSPPMTLPILAEDPQEPPEGQAFLYFDSRDSRIKLRQGGKTFAMMVSEEGSLFTTTWRYDDYLSFVLFSALVFGIAFELPMVILILAQTGIVPTQTFRNIRKYAYFGILITAALVAPAGDLMTLFFLTIPLIGLYELGIVAAAFMIRRDQRAKESA